MITLMVVALGFLVVVAIVVGILETAQASAWRRVAAERRERWEAGWPEARDLDPHHGHD